MSDLAISSFSTYESLWNRVSDTRPTKRVGHRSMGLGLVNGSEMGWVGDGVIGEILDDRLATLLCRSVALKWLIEKTKEITGQPLMFEPDSITWKTTDAGRYKGRKPGLTRSVLFVEDFDDSIDGALVMAAHMILDEEKKN